MQAAFLKVLEVQAPPAAAVYFGTKADYAPLTEAQIRQAAAHQYVPGASVTAAYTNVLPMFMWAAWPASETGITRYFINDFDHGELGPDGSFSAPVQIGAFLYTQSNYPTSTGGQSVIFQHA